MRGQARDYDQWAAAHRRRRAGAGSAACPSSSSTRTTTRAPSRGPRRRRRMARRERQRLRWDMLDAFAQAAQQAGIPATEDFNRGDNEGVGYFQVNQKSGWRWNTAKAFLRPICYGPPQLRDVDRCAGARGWSSSAAPTAAAAAPARRCGPATSCVSVHADARGDAVRGQHRLAAAPAAVRASARPPCCASTASPVVHDLPGVGANLQDHLQIRAVFKVRGVQTLNTLANSWCGKAAIGLEYALERSGPDEHGAVAAGRLHAQHARPALAEHRVPRAAAQPRCLWRAAAPISDAFTASVCNLNPTSRGTVRIRSARFEDAPAIAPNYLSTPEDRQVAADSLRVTRRIGAQPALASYQPEEWRPGAAVPERRGTGAAGRRHRHHHLPPGRHHQDGPRRRPDGGAGLAAARARRAPACAWSTPARCPPSPAATPTRRP